MGFGDALCHFRTGRLFAVRLEALPKEDNLAALPALPGKETEQGKQVPLPPALAPVTAQVAVVAPRAVRSLSGMNLRNGNHLTSLLSAGAERHGTFVGADQRGRGFASHAALHAALQRDRENYIPGPRDWLMGQRLLSPLAPASRTFLPHLALIATCSHGSSTELSTRNTP